MQNNYYNWIQEDNFLDVPLISPHLIPQGYVQHWDSQESKYVLLTRGNRKVWKTPKTLLDAMLLLRHEGKNDK